MSRTRRIGLLVLALLLIPLIVPARALAQPVGFGGGSSGSSGYIDTAYINGLVVTKNAGGDSIDISAGVAYDPSSSTFVTYAGATAVNAGTLGNSQWNQVYLYANAGTPTIAVVNNADPPSTAYAGTARKDGSSHRWIGSFLTTSTAHLYAQDVKETAHGQMEVMWLATTNAVPFRVLSAGASVTYASVSLVAAIPRYVAVEGFMESVLDGLTANNIKALFSLDGTNQSSSVDAYVVVGGATFPTLTTWQPLVSSTPSLQYEVAGTSAALYLDVSGYRFVR